MRLYEKSKEIANIIGDRLLRLFAQDFWMGILWICLGLATLDNVYLTDFISFVGPIVVGVLLIIPIKHKDMFYFVGGFAVVADRVLVYVQNSVWSPLIVWVIVGTYVTSNIGRKR